MRIVFWTDLLSHTWTIISLCNFSAFVIGPSDIYIVAVPLSKISKCSLLNVEILICKWAWICWLDSFQSSSVLLLVVCSGSSLSHCPFPDTLPHYREHTRCPGFQVSLASGQPWWKVGSSLPMHFPQVLSQAAPLTVAEFPQLPCHTKSSSPTVLLPKSTQAAGLQECCSSPVRSAPVRERACWSRWHLGCLTFSCLTPSFFITCLTSSLTVALLCIRPTGVSLWKLTSSASFHTLSSLTIVFLVHIHHFVF